ncbi:putative glucan endo-1,3-beta-glucosidase 7 [Iris pallida]|uniref:glucan endo-1,3-beta-D-glucosidase n=1 Tax=Iris pallida TaxID=29817 RepID=A0AAX6FFM8_IRIPA|nr:putative glucan endo-1,3-beta-glucosidase 7 [Iris pallida]
MEQTQHRLLFAISAVLLLFSSAAQPFIGVNYGQVADNLPPPDATARLLQSTSISKVRLYGADPAILNALANTGISITIGASNADIPSLAADPSAASAWVSANVLPFLPASSISTVSVGNEIFELADPSLSAQLLPAMQNLRSALAANPLSAAVKVSTVNTMAVLSRSEPPSSGAFRPELLPPLRGVLGFLNQTGSPFMVNPYPFFAYGSDPRPETLAFCLFRPNAGRPDAGTGATYTNMFDAQLDAVRSALAAAGFAGAEIVVAETGWPYRGDADEPGASVENARAYNGNLIKHLESGVGTPLMPGKSVDTYIFALYDEDLKPGPTSERSFGLFRPDLTMNYDVGLSKSSSASGSGSGSSSGQAKNPTSTTAWCVPKEGTADEQLQAALDYACAQPGVDCGPIQPGGACYEPDTVRSHAAYAMNQLYQVSGRNSEACDFSQSATLSSDNPSYDACVYSGGQ